MPARDMAADDAGWDVDLVLTPTGGDVPAFGRRSEALALLHSYKSRITSIYEQHDPGKVGEVVQLLSKYEQQVEKVDDLDLDAFVEKSKVKLDGLCRALCAKYGVSPEASQSTPGASPPQQPQAAEGGPPPPSPRLEDQEPWDPADAYRSRILDIYRAHNPSKLDNVDSLLVKYAGNEASLYRSVCNKYGVEPEADPCPPDDDGAADAALAAAAEEAKAAAAAAAAKLSSWGSGFWSSGLKTLHTLQTTAEGLKDQVEKSFDEAIRSEEDISVMEVVSELRTSTTPPAPQARPATAFVGSHICCTLR